MNYPSTEDSEENLCCVLRHELIESYVMMKNIEKVVLNNYF
jgi:hypothetical protein